MTPTNSVSPSTSRSGPESTPAMTSSAPVANNAQPAPASKLAAFNRSTSPHVKPGEGTRSSPGLRNAAIASSGRSSSPSTTGSGATSAPRTAPWASIKAESGTSALPRPSDFPTAAEVARAKQEAERREKELAAEAAARSEQALHNLDSFRGTSLGAGNHWDEMEDDDFGEVVKFADGTQYKVPVRDESAVNDQQDNVSKEDRFQDVDHDRSWPPRANSLASHPLPRLAGSGTHDSVQKSANLSRPVKPEAMAVRSEEGVSLESSIPTDRDRGFSNWGASRDRIGTSSNRRDRDAHGATHSAVQAVPHPSTAQIRAWGPLAQRQAALNPDGSKVSESKPSPKQAHVELKSPESKPVSIGVTQGLSSPETKGVWSNKNASNRQQDDSTQFGGHEERGLPPHLVGVQNQLHKRRTSHVERADWEKARPKVLDEESSDVMSTQESQQKWGPRVSATDSVPSTTQPLVNPDNQRNEMLSAAERARQRRQQEEEEREKEKERARAKAAQLEEKIRSAKEEEERKKREELSKQQEEARALESKRRAEEKKHEEERHVFDYRRDRSDSRGKVLFEDERQKSHRIQQNKPRQDPTPSVLSPSDEAISWRRSSSALPLHSAAPGPSGRSKTRPEHPADIALENPGELPTRILLRRSANDDEDGEVEAQPSSKPFEKKADVSGNIAGVGHEISDGPRSGRAKKDESRGSIPGSAKFDSKSSKQTRNSRVEIIAPTDQGAAKHNEQALGRQTKKTTVPSGPPTSVLKSSSLMSTRLEQETTRPEVEFDPPPVWHRFKVKIGPHRTSRPHMSKSQEKAQAAKMALARDERSRPKEVNIQSWDPPLTTRTLSRDEMFFPRKYRRGVLIAGVLIPRMSMNELAEQRKVQRAQVQTKSTSMETTNEVQTPHVKVKVPLSSSAAGSAALSKSGLTLSSKDFMDQTSRSRSRVRRDGEPVAFAGGHLPHERFTPSPVNFMLNSDLTTPSSELSANATATGSVTKPQSTLPSPNQVASTWGQSTLTFAGLDHSSSIDPPSEEQNHIKNVWSQSSPSKSNVPVPSQNSLRGIADEVPAAMSMSMQELRTEDAAESNDVVSAPQYNDIGINTASSAPGSRVYSPLRDSSTRELSLTASSSPIASAERQQSHTLESSSKEPKRSLSQSPSRPISGDASLNLMDMDADQSESKTSRPFHFQNRANVSAAFGPYAYPNTHTGYQGYQPDYGSGSFGGGRSVFAGDDVHSNRHRAYRNNAPSNTSAMNGYSTQMTDFSTFPSEVPSMGMTTAGWPLDNPAMGYAGVSNATFGASPMSYPQTGAYPAMMSNNASGYPNQYRQAQGYQGRNASNAYSYSRNYHMNPSSQRNSSYRSSATAGSDTASPSLHGSGLHATAKPFRYSNRSSQGESRSGPDSTASAHARRSPIRNANNYRNSYEPSSEMW